MSIGSDVVSKRPALVALLPYGCLRRGEAAAEHVQSVGAHWQLVIPEANGAWASG